MNLKSAKEIVNHPENYCDNLMLHQKFDNAKGFVYCHEKMLPLVRAFDQLVNPPVRKQCKHGILLNEVWFCAAKEALENYRKEVEGL